MAVANRGQLADVQIRFYTKMLLGGGMEKDKWAYTNVAAGHMEAFIKE